jgi:hypothetical protein
MKGKKMVKKYIYVKLTKKWSRYKVGDVIRFGLKKGRGRIDSGYGVEVPPQKAVNEPVKDGPKVETATKNPISDPKIETTNAAPQKVSKPKKVSGPEKSGKLVK